MTITQFDHDLIAQGATEDGDIFVRRTECGVMLTVYSRDNERTASLFLSHADVRMLVAFLRTVEK